MRHYKRKVGARAYASTYTQVTLAKAISSVRTGKLSRRKASAMYHIPLGTLNNKINNKCTKRVGAPLRLTAECEERLLITIDHLSEWKLPLDATDIKLLVKDYLDRSGVTDSRFKNNCPGNDWLKSFITRHRLTQRLADNVKPARAEINRESVNVYFDELEQALADVQPDNIYNYDETNVTDDPGVKTVVCRRGLKRVERKIQHSKSAISIMYCGSATGTFLPPMVVYRAGNCYEEWTRGGPAGSLYESTKSGWFDARTFTRWFTDIFVEHVKHQGGTKVLIGDNLASHFTHEVVNQCVANNIRFICLLPNATHLLQPLDVAVFRSLKIEWRKILDCWRRESRVKGSIPKNQFPGLLAKLQNQLKSDNLISGFRASGIYPVDRQNVLKRLPEHNKDTVGNNVAEIFNEAISGLLKKHCGYGEKKKNARGKKITPGKPVQPEDLGEVSTSAKQARSLVKKKRVQPDDPSSSDSDVEPSDNDDPLTSDEETESNDKDLGEVSTSAKQARSLVKKKRVQPDPSSSDSDVEPSDNDDPLTSDEETESNDKDLGEVSTSAKQARSLVKKKRVQPDPSSSDSDVEPSDNDDPLTSDEETESNDKVVLGEWLVVAYPGKKSISRFIGQVVSIPSDATVEVKFVRRVLGGSTFKYPAKEDVDIVDLSSIESHLDMPNMNNREQYVFQKINPLMYG